MIVKLPLPRTGSTSSDRATVVAWHVEVGSSIEVGQPVADVETDKSVVSVESTVAGVVTELTVPLNDEVEIGHTLLQVDDGIVGEATAPPATDPVPRASDAAQAVTPQASPTQRTEVDGATVGIRATPAARRRSRELGIDLASVAPGSGPLGRVEVADVERAGHGVVARSISASAPPAWANKLKGSRRTIALRMAAAHAEVVPVTLFRDADVTALAAWTSAQAGEWSFLDALLATVARVLPRHSAVNAHLDERGIVEHREVHLGYAVDGARGLVVPVIRDAHRLDLAQFASSRRSIVKQALAGSLSADAAEGATFSVSNLGSLGVGRFTPIVSPPQVAILGLGAVTETFELRADGSVAAIRKLPLSLTFDHRAVDGAPAARFLADVVAAFGDAGTLR